MTPQKFFELLDARLEARAHRESCLFLGVLPRDKGAALPPVPPEVLCAKKEALYEELISLMVRDPSHNYE